MNDYRVLEYKFKEEIEKHLKKALPNIHDVFAVYRASNDYEDSNLSFDLVFNLEFTVSIRIRKNKYLKFNDLTIRSKSKQNNKTEIDKINEGMAQVYFYAYMDKLESKLIKVRIAKVEAIRKLYNEKKFQGPKKNMDGTEFISFTFKDISDFHGGIYKFDD